MLVLEREVDETVLIGDDVVVTVLRVYGGKVLLGFTAPKDVPVDRSEFRAKKAAGLAAPAGPEGGAA